VGNFLLAERLLASQEGLWSIELVSYGYIICLLGFRSVTGSNGW